MGIIHKIRLTKTFPRVCIAATEAAAPEKSCSRIVPGGNSSHAESLKVLYTKMAAVNRAPITNTMLASIINPLFLLFCRLFCSGHIV